MKWLKYDPENPPKQADLIGYDYSGVLVWDGLYVTQSYYSRGSFRDLDGNIIDGVTLYTVITKPEITE